MRQLLIRKVLQKAFLIVAFFFIADVLIAALSWTSFGRLSPVLFLSDLFFLEGSAFMAIGIFIAVAMAWREPQSKADESTVESENDEGPHFSIQMMFVGAILIALSIVAGTLSPLI